MRFRIKIQTLNNGKKQYFPQVKRHIIGPWDSLYRSYYSDHISVSQYVQNFVDSVNTANDIITKYKAQLANQSAENSRREAAFKANKVKETTYVEYK